MYNRAHSIEADVEIPAGGAEGVLLAQGGDAGGYAFYVKDGRLCFLYNYVGLDRFEVRAEDGGSTEGRHALRYEFEPTGEPDIANGKGAPGAGSSTSTARSSAPPSSRTRRRCSSSSKA